MNTWLFFSSPFCLPLPSGTGLPSWIPLSADPLCRTKASARLGASPKRTCHQQEEPVPQTEVLQGLRSPPGSGLRRLCLYLHKMPSPSLLSSCQLQWDLAQFQSAGWSQISNCLPQGDKHPRTDESPFPAVTLFSEILISPGQLCWKKLLGETRSF